MLGGLPRGVVAAMRDIGRARVVEDGVAAWFETEWLNDPRPLAADVWVFSPDFGSVLTSNGAAQFCSACGVDLIVAAPGPGLRPCPTPGSEAGRHGDGRRRRRRLVHPKSVTVAMRRDALRDEPVSPCGMPTILFIGPAGGRAWCARG